MSMQFDEEDLAVGQAPLSSGGYDDEAKFQDDPPQVYESPAKVQYESPVADLGPNVGKLNRTPPRKISVPEDAKPPKTYTQIQDPTPLPSMQPTSIPEPWSKGGVGGAEMYGIPRPQQFAMPQEMHRPQTSQPFYNEAPPLRYGMNETGSYIPQHPKLVHANSTPVSAMQAPSYPSSATNAGKYKNENVL